MANEGAGTALAVAEQHSSTGWTHLCPREVEEEHCVCVGGGGEEEEGA